MSATYRAERDRGIKQYRQQLAELRKKWPLAFPVRDQDVRPLAVDATYEIAADTLGVLSRWKLALLYCEGLPRDVVAWLTSPWRAGVPTKLGIPWTVL